MGDVAVSVVDGIWFKATGDEFWIDTSMSLGTADTAADYRKDVHVPDGKSVFFSPPQLTGSIYVMASTAATYEYFVTGQTS